MPSLRNDCFHASRLETSGTLSESTLMWQTTPVWGLAGFPISPASGAETTSEPARRQVISWQDMVAFLRCSSSDQSRYSMRPARLLAGELLHRRDTPMHGYGENSQP